MLTVTEALLDLADAVSAVDLSARLVEVHLPPGAYDSINREGRRAGQVYGLPRLLILAASGVEVKVHAIETAHDETPDASA